MEAECTNKNIVLVEIAVASGWIVDGIALPGQSYAGDTAEGTVIDTFAFDSRVTKN